MTSKFSPAEELELFCRFCEKILPAQLDRSIAENGKIVDKSSVFEYYCTKCFKTICISGDDLLDETVRKSADSEEARPYTPRNHYLIGEKLFHSAFKEAGTVVGKENSTPVKILVLFEKNGLKKLVMDL
jgi:hypothetical protein